MIDKMTAIYNYIMSNKILRKDRYDIIEIHNYYLVYGKIEGRVENLMMRLLMKYENKVV